jgi:phage-related tail fiber protein
MIAGVICMTVLFDRNNSGRYQADSSIYSLFYGSDSFLTEDELNESQWNQIEINAAVLREQFSSGFIKNYTINAGHNNFFGITNSDANPLPMLINGYFLRIGNNSQSVTPPGGLTRADNTLIFKLNTVGAANRTDLVLLEVWFEVMNKTETIKKFGGVDTPSITNLIIDPRYDAETSRRIQLRWRVRSIDNKNSMTGVTAYKYDGTDSAIAYSSFGNIYLANTGQQNFAGALKSPGIVYGIPLFTVSRNATDMVAIENITDISVKAGLGSTSITAGTGLTLSGNTLSITNTGVSAGTYKSVTVNTQGQVTAGVSTLTASDVGLGNVTNESKTTMFTNAALTGVSTAVTAAAATNTTQIATTAYVKSQNYLTGNQTVTVSGDATGSGTTAISLTLANSGVGAGTYKSVTVDAKGRVTSGTNPTTLAGYGITDSLQKNVYKQTSTPSTPVLDDLWVDTTLTPHVLKRYDGSAWQQIGGAGSSSVTNVSSSNTDIAVANPTTSPVLTLNSGTGANQIVKLNESGLVTSDILTDGTANKAYTATEKTKLAGISTAANKTLYVSNGVLSFDGSNTTVYTHPAGDGNLHVPVTSTTNNTKVLKAGATAGSLSWAFVDWSELINRPTTLSTYGITDGVNTSEVVTTAAASKILKLDANSKLPASITGNADGNAATATKWATGRTIALTGDATGTSVAFDGAANLSFAVTLANAGTAGTYTKVTTDAKGRITSGTTLVAGDIPTITLAKISDAGTAASKNTGTASGNVPILDGSGKLDTSVLPGLALTTTNVVASQVAMLALTAEPGDLAVRTDLNKTFVLKTAGASTLANWQELLTPTDVVTSVASKTGVVTLVSSDVGLGNVTNESKTTMFTNPTFTGTGATLPADPTLNLHATTKQYVDAQIAIAKNYAP